MRHSEKQTWCPGQKQCTAVRITWTLHCVVQQQGQAGGDKIPTGWATVVSQMHQKWRLTESLSLAISSGATWGWISEQKSLSELSRTKAGDHIQPREQPELPGSLPWILNGAFSGEFACVYFPGLTEEETRNCVRYETKKRFLFFTKTYKEDRCTTNRLSEKYKGNRVLWALYPVCPEPARHLTIFHVTAVSSFIFFCWPQNTTCCEGK